MNPWFVFGPLLAVWAVIVALLGITRESFPGSAARLVGAISVVLALLAIASAIYGGIRQEDKRKNEGERSSLIVPL